MSKVIGLAFSSPGVALLSVDRKKYKLFHYERNSLSDFRLFLSSTEDKLPVVFLTNVRQLKELKDIGKEVECFVLFEDPKVLQNIEGAVSLDFEPSTATTWKKKLVSPEEFSAALEDKEKADFNITDKALLSSNEMIQEMSIYELMRRIQNQYEELGKNSEEITKQACKYTIKLINKKTWVSTGRKPALADGIDIKTLAELEKFIETSKEADELWRGIHELSHKGTATAELLSKFKLKPEALEFVMSTLELKPGEPLQFDSEPGISKRKRQSRTKKDLTPAEE